MLEQVDRQVVERVARQVELGQPGEALEVRLAQRNDALAGEAQRPDGVDLRIGHLGAGAGRGNRQHDGGAHRGVTIAHPARQALGVAVDLP